MFLAYPLFNNKFCGANTKSTPLLLSGVSFSPKHSKDSPSDNEEHWDLGASIIVIIIITKIKLN